MISGCGWGLCCATGEVRAAWNGALPIGDNSHHTNNLRSSHLISSHLTHFHRVTFTTRLTATPETFTRGVTHAPHLAPTVFVVPRRLTMRWLLRPVSLRARPCCNAFRPLAQLRRSSTISDFRVDEVPCGSSGVIPIS